MAIRLIFNIALHLVGFGIIFLLFLASLSSQNPVGTRIWALGVSFGVLLVLPLTRGLLLTRFGISISLVVAILFFILIYFGLLTLTPSATNEVDMKTSQTNLSEFQIEMPPELMSVKSKELCFDVTSTLTMDSTDRTAHNLD